MRVISVLFPFTLPASLDWHRCPHPLFFISFLSFSVLAGFGAALLFLPMTQDLSQCQHYSFLSNLIHAAPLVVLGLSFQGLSFASLPK